MEVDIHVVAGVGNGAGAHRSQLGLLAAADRDADVHPHRAQVRSEGGRRAVRAPLSGHVPVPGAGAVHGRSVEQTASDHADRVPEIVEHRVHVGRRCRAGRARLHREHGAHHRAVRVHRGHRVYVQRRVQHQPPGPVAQLRRAAHGHHQLGRVHRRHYRAAVRRAHRRRSGELLVIDPIICL